jgi:hypothetical protein
VHIPKITAALLGPAPTGLRARWVCMAAIPPDAERPETGRGKCKNILRIKLLGTKFEEESFSILKSALSASRERPRHVHVPIIRRGS